MDLLVFWFAASVLRTRRPTGSAFAWILVILFVPYLGIPLYLFLGGRKFQLQAKSKPHLLPSGENGHLDSAERVEWLDDGVRAYETFLNEIRHAKRSIRIVTFIIGSDTTGRSLLEALTRRAQEGVEVLLLLDDLFCFKAPHHALARLRKAGGKIERFMPLLHFPFRGQANLRNHRKIAIFDGERAIVGGMNLAQEYMGPAPRADRWRDLSILINGPCVTVLDSIFRADWKFASGVALAALDPIQAPGQVPIRTVPSGPDSDSDPIYDEMLSMIFRAQRRFWVATPYFVPDDPLVRALAVAARRGVDVRIVLPVRSNHLLADLASAPYLRELADAGVKVRRVPRMLHAKVVLEDNAVAAVGSANFDMRSLFLDYEISLFFTGAAEIDRMTAWFEETLKDSADGPPISGILRSRLETVACLLAPLL